MNIDINKYRHQWMVCNELCICYTWWSLAQLKDGYQTTVFLFSDITVLLFLDVTIFLFLDVTIFFFLDLRVFLYLDFTVFLFLDVMVFLYLDVGLTLFRWYEFFSFKVLRSFFLSDVSGRVPIYYEYCIVCVYELPPPHAVMYGSGCNSV